MMMTQDLTPEAVAAMMEGVTPGPWEIDGIAIAGNCRRSGDVCLMGEPAQYAGDTAQMLTNWEANARFIAWAREAVPALAAKLAEVEARAVLDGLAMTVTAMARDRAMTNLEHWRQEVGKLHSQIAKERADLQAAEAEVARLREYYAASEAFAAEKTTGNGTRLVRARAALTQKEKADE